MEDVQPPDDDELLTSAETNRTLGITQRTLDRDVEAKRLRPLYLPSGHRRFRKSEVLALLDRRASA